MSKKDFIALADALRESGATQTVLDAIAALCAADNPRFNRARWFGYIKGTCGPSGGAPRPGKGTQTRSRA